MATAVASKTSATPARHPKAVRGTVWLPALAGSVLWFMAQPPLGWWPLAWVAPVPWLWLAAQPSLPGRRPYLVLWLAGTCYWLLALNWLRLPHPATSLGWVVLSVYLGAYLPLLVALVRVGWKQWGWPLAPLAAAVWVGLELLQAHLFTGISIATLAHTQYRWLTLIQVADLGGEHLVSGLMVLAAGALTAILLAPRRVHAWLAALPVAAVIAAALLYGHLRLGPSSAAAVPLRVALVQTSMDTEFRFDPDEPARALDQLLDLSRQALAADPTVGLIVWPETMYREPLLDHTPDAHPAVPDEWTSEQLEASAAEYRRRLGLIGQALGRPVVVGLDAHVYGPGRVDRYNAAQLVLPDGSLGPRYDKMHPVMFGEYVPLGDLLPWLYRLTPMPSGLSAGRRAEVFEVGGLRFAPSICYENVLSHRIRGQVAELQRQGREPDVLLSLTNDGWFWGSAELDMHLVCGVFRAVECRRPMLIAANTGFSAAIDADGRIVAQAPRRQQAFLVVDAQADPRRSLYQRWGDWPAAGCLALCAALALAGWWNRGSQRGG